MPITMSGATIDTSERDSLLSSTVDTSVVSGGATANTQSVGGLAGVFGAREASGSNLAGITSSFATNVCGKIDDYKTAISTALGELQNVESNEAFKGSAISAALSEFVESVRKVGNNYITKLSSAEAQIINSVQSAYSTQDTDLSGSINADAGNLQN